MPSPQTFPKTQTNNRSRFSMTKTQRRELLEQLKTHKIDILRYKVQKNLILMQGIRAITRQCEHCQEFQPYASFYGDSRVCKPCYAYLLEVSKQRSREYRSVVSRNRKRKLKDIADGTVTLVSLRKILILQDNRCAVCSVDITPSEFRHLDHIQPISRGGKHAIFNVRWLCVGCNLKKYNRLDSEGWMYA